MINRILEPEVMDDTTEAQEYDQMDFSEVNRDFAQLACQLVKDKALVLDIGTGTARIPLIMAQLRPQWQIIGIDLAESMIKLGKQNVEKEGKSQQITLDLIDGKKTPYEDHTFDLVVSNSLVHHIPSPLELLKEINRIVKPQGTVLIRDLFRPSSLKEIEGIVKEANLSYTPRQEKLFKDSLQAALTLEEIKELVMEVGWHDAKVYQSSSRHWTVLS